MPEKDAYSNNFLSNRETQADIINYFFFDRKRVITADQIHERDSVLKIASPEVEAIFGRPIERRRDLLFAVSKLGEPGAVLFFEGCESQSNIDPNMPYRALEYDFLGIAKQYQDEKKRKNQDKKKRKKDEVKNCPEEETKNTEIRKEPGSFKPWPVITFVINLSGRRWTGPLNFVDTLDFELLPKDKYPLQYLMLLIDPWSMTEEELNFFRTDFGELLRILAHGDYDEQLKYAIKQFRTKVEIQKSSIWDYLGEYLNFDFAKLNEEGEEPMIEGRLIHEQGLIQKGRREGRNEGIFEEKTATVRRLLSRNSSIEDIAFTTNLSEEQVRDIIHNLEEVKYN